MTREVLYDKVEAVICENDAQLEVAQAKELLGWSIPEEGKRFEPDNIHLKDLEGNQVHCANVVQFQRRFYLQSVKDYMWDILGGHWEQNGDTITVGKTGFVLDGKHRLTALVLASQEWERNPERYPFWKSEPTMPAIIIFGIKEESKIVNTIGTGRTRTLADSVFSSGLFEGVTRAEATKLSRILEHAVRLLWHRTGAMNDAYSPRISHSEAFDFVQRHPTLLDCVRTVFSEEKDGKLSRYISLGYLAGFMYMMATSDCTTEDYLASPEPNESLLGELKSYEKADEFVAALASNDKRLNLYFEELKKLELDDRLNVKVRMILLVQAWVAFFEDRKMKKEDVALDYETYDGRKILISDPVTGGIDRGFGEE